MIELESRKNIRKFCLEQDFDYYKTLLFVQKQIKATESLIYRKLSEEELVKEIDMTLTYLSKFGRDEGLKSNDKKLREKEETLEEQTINIESYRDSQKKEGELNLF